MPKSIVTFLSSYCTLRRKELEKLVACMVDGIQIHSANNDNDYPLLYDFGHEFRSRSPELKREMVGLKCESRIGQLN